MIGLCCRRRSSTSSLLSFVIGHCYGAILSFCVSTLRDVDFLGRDGCDGLGFCYREAESGRPSRPCIPRALASLVRAPFAGRKGRGLHHLRALILNNVHLNRAGSLVERGVERLADIL